MKQSKESTLKSHLSTTSLVVLGVSSTIGSGIYTVTGVVAKELAGAYVILCFLLAGLIALSNALAYSELSCRYKGCGGIFTFIYLSWGVTQGFLVGWLNLHGGVASICLVAQTFGSYMYQILDQTTWIVTSNITYTNNSGSPEHFSSLNSYGVNLPATMLIVLSSSILISGTTNLFNVTKLTTAVSILALLTFIICGLKYGDVQNIMSLKPHNVGQIHISGILKGAAICYFAYTGFSAVHTSSEEAKDAKRSIPIAIFVVMVFVGLLYSGVTVSVLMLQPYWLFDTKAPLMAAVHYAHINRMKYVILVGMTVGLIQVNLSCLYQVSRLVFSMARDKLLPSVLATVSGNNRTPMLAIIVGGLYSVVACSLISFRTLISFSAICIFVNSTLANILIIWINCYTELIEASEHKLCDISTMSSIKPSSIAEKTTDSMALQPLTDSNKTIVRQGNTRIATNSLSDNLSIDINEFSKSLTNSKQTTIIVPRVLKKTCYNLKKEKVLRIGNYDQKWYLIIVLMTITCSCVFLSGTIILYSEGNQDFHYSSLLTICVCGVLLMFATIHLCVLKSYINSMKYLGIRMIMVPCLPILNIFIDIYMLVSMCNSIGCLCYIFLAFLGMIIYSTINRRLVNMN